MAEKLTNYYFVVNAQEPNDCEALKVGAKIVEATGEPVEMRECGTKRLICRLSADKNLGFTKEARENG